MKKSLQVTLEDTDVIELMRILLDEDAEGALTFLAEPISKAKPGICWKAAERFRLHVPGTGDIQVTGNLFRK